jgi:hypothetical protein
VTPEEIREQVRRLDTTSVRQEQEAWGRVRELGVAAVPYLAEAYPSFRKWQGRASLVFHCTRHARVSEEAFRLGLLALADKAAQVRFRACSLLAYAQKQEALPRLEALLDHADPRTVADAKAAVDAITRRNHHYFVDRDHTGRAFWQVTEGDGCA